MEELLLEKTKKLEESKHLIDSLQKQTKEEKRERAK
jgi:hypothetical protein